ncbi:MAG: hypothetical protein K2Z81_00785 [Cyanobacteria bacterium]|nr:hypothetical protein [Cyanobacteriota bacterium]
MSTDSELQNRIEELRGPQTGEVIDMSGMAWTEYDDSKVWFVTNVGRDPQGRQSVINFLKDKNIEILEEESIFHYIRITLPDHSQWKSLNEELQQQFDCRLSHDR